MAFKASRSDFVREWSTGASARSFVRRNPGFAPGTFKARPSHQTGRTRSKTTRVRDCARRSDGSSGTGDRAMTTTAVPAVEGWFTTDAEPHLLGTRCTTCATVFFPRATGFCRNPECRGREFDEIELARM